MAQKLAPFFYTLQLFLAFKTLAFHKVA